MSDKNLDEVMLGALAGCGLSLIRTFLGALGDSKVIKPRSAFDNFVSLGLSILLGIVLVKGCSKVVGQTPIVEPLKPNEKQKIGAVNPSPFQTPSFISSLRPTSGVMKV